MKSKRKAQSVKKKIPVPMINYQVRTFKSQENRQDIKGTKDKIEKVPLLEEGDDM